jgi:hypothetical protein
MEGEFKLWITHFNVSLLSLVNSGLPCGPDSAIYKGPQRVTLVGLLKRKAGADA